MNNAPIDMVLYCPKCALQHIDAPEPEQELTGTEHTLGDDGRLHAAPYAYRGRPAGAWLNPPHKSHLCAGCGHVWRPSDHPTNGVLRTASGKDADCDPRALLLKGASDYKARHINPPTFIIDRAAYDAIAGQTDEDSRRRDGEAWNGPNGLLRWSHAKRRWVLPEEWGA